MYGTFGRSPQPPFPIVTWKFRNWNASGSGNGGRVMSEKMPDDLWSRDGPGFTAIATIVALRCSAKYAAANMEILALGTIVMV